MSRIMPSGFYISYKVPARWKKDSEDTQYRVNSIIQQNQTLYFEGLSLIIYKNTSIKSIFFEMTDVFFLLTLLAKKPLSTIWLG